MVLSSTRDLTKFKCIQGNRALNHLHIKRLSESVKEDNLLELQPILVNEKYEVIDGQHRLEVAKALKLKIFYLKKKGLGLKEVHRLNENNKNWKGEDFLEGYCDMGLKDYLQFKRFKDKYNLGFSICYVLLCGSDNNKTSNDFKDGKLKITDLKTAQRIASIINEFASIFEFSKTRSFVSAVRKADSKGADLDLLLDKCTKRRTDLFKCPDSKGYLVLLEMIYNKHNRNKIHFREL